jgi:hypothetical protein
MESLDDHESRSLPESTLVISVISGYLCLIAATLDSASVALFCLQKLSIYLTTHLTSTSALVWTAAVWFTAAGVTTFAVQEYLFLRKFRLHFEFPVAHRNQTTTSLVPALINFTGTGPSYEYETLGTGYIRILELLPSDNSKPISCHLHQVNLKSLPRYEALSYTWGTEKADCAISIDGKRFMVRQISTMLCAYSSQHSQPNADGFGLMLFASTRKTGLNERNKF